MGQALEPRNDMQNVVDAVWTVLKSVDQVTSSEDGKGPVPTRFEERPKLLSHQQHPGPMDIEVENTLARDPECLADIPQPSLKKLMEPIMASLRKIDAKLLLKLQRVGANMGPQIDSNTFVRPIYDRVRPPINNIEADAGRSCVRYLHIDEVPDQYSMGIFVFAPHAKIPLHDHPNMCVLSRVLYGSLERLSLDLARDEGHGDIGKHPHTEPAKVLGNHSKYAVRRDSSGSDSDRPSDSSWFDGLWNRKQKSPQLPEGSKRAFKNHIDTLQAPDVTILYPFEGNLHEFVAGPDGAAVLDVLVPPYDHVNNRDCTFYHIHDVDEPAAASSKKSGGKTPCFIVPTGQPEDFHCISGQYGSLGAFDDQD